MTQPVALITGSRRYQQALRWRWATGYSVVLSGTSPEADNALALCAGITAYYIPCDVSRTMTAVR